MIELFSTVDADDERGRGAESAAAAAAARPMKINADEVFVVKITASYARDFVARAQALVAAGRPPCPFCLQPLDPSGHICPRANGYRRPLFDCRRGCRLSRSADHPALTAATDRR